MGVGGILYKSQRPRVREAPRSQCRIEVRDLYGRVRGRIEGTEGYGNPKGRPTVSTNLDSWGFSVTELPTKEHTWAGPRPPCSYVTDVQLDLHVGPE